MATQVKQDFQPSLKQQILARERARRKGRSDEVSLTAISHPVRNDLTPELKLVTRRLADLKLREKRPRKVNPDQLERVIASIQVLGFLAPLLINAKGEIINGAIVAEAARRLGLEEVQCLVVEHLSPEEERLAHVTLNNLPVLGKFELEELATELQELEAFGLDLSITGFDASQLDLILGTVVDEALVSDVIPPVPFVPVSRPGDLWILGDHVQYCGDAREASSYLLLLAGEVINCVFSDPPYNIKIDGVVSGLGKVKHSDFAMGCGEMSDDGFTTFLSTYLTRCREHCAEGAVMFACMDWRQIDLLLLAGRNAGLERINKVVWFKGSGGMGGLYRSAYEEIAVFCTAKSPGTNNVLLGRGGRDRMNVWEYPGANRIGSSAGKALKDHPTPKPVELVADALLDVTKRGDIVFDPFMGSGTTLMACEKEKRRCRGIELDPAYVDVTIRRWQDATGKVAIHANERMTFEQLAIARAQESEESKSSGDAPA
ncbi:DNA modification methylase [Rhizorhabdus dicambivorans]|uniref:Methyltransferase n=1 Tax=Rhizorhabdus dicambivorans TaxID=1850238 RepID=A0A2A4FXV2_9SPHN|nr:DNA modification methylase [Rhizorhabdus dicambivorans]ATE64196.1 DNA methylase [Rhizorhabdus dicambivorans]PCE42532.1 DNA methylase [Rhizorhabdus dicambivorans]